MLARIRRAIRRSARDPLGPRGERAAARYLRRRGYRVLGRNVRVRVGEADLVCKGPDGTIVVVEVKARRGADPGSPGAAVEPEDAITAHKRRKLLAITRSLSRLNGWDGTPVRIDVVAVQWPDGRKGKPRIRHFPSAVGLQR